jgi:hypothetical protein
MNYLNIIEQVRESAAEWLEMSENPDEIVIGILAKQVIKLHAENAILEGRLRCRQSTAWE